MSHRKVHSQGNIPFSWEDSPGVSKAIHQDFPLDTGLNALIISPPPVPSPTTTMPFSTSSSSSVSAHQESKIPLPPCQKLQPPTRSVSDKGFGWAEDPFLAAYKECTKNVRRKGNKLLPSENKNNGIASTNKLRRSKFIAFPCKNSCDVKDDNFVRLPNLPPIPKDRVRIRR